MPVVRIKGTEEWLPSDGKVHSKQHKDIKSLIEQLRGLVVEAVNWVDESSLTVRECIVHVTTAHPWDQNASDVCIDVEPGEVSGDERLRAARRLQISMRLAERISFIVAGWPKQPSFEVDCRPLTGSGVAYDEVGVLVHMWNKPKPQQER